MRTSHQILAVAILTSTTAIGHAADEYAQPMTNNSHMPMLAQYQGPMHPMQMRRQWYPAAPAPVDNTPAAPSTPPAQQQATTDTSAQSKAPEYPQHKPPYDFRMEKMKAMQQQQKQMLKHMQRIESHLGNIETLIRQLVENR